jgi:glutathione synthase
LLLNGRFLGAFLRKPPRHDFRANLGLGGSMHRCGLTKKEEKIIAGLSPVLWRHGLYFTGLDVIGGYLSEVNVTSPSGIPEMRQLYGRQLEKDVADFIEKRPSWSFGRKR